MDSEQAPKGIVREGVCFGAKVFWAQKPLLSFIHYFKNSNQMSLPVSKRIKTKKSSFTMKDSTTLSVKLAVGNNFKWVGKAPWGIQAGKHSNKVYVCLDADVTQEPTGKDTYDVVTAISASCEEIFKDNVIMVRALLNIPKDNTVVIHPGGSYDAENKTFTFWPHELYCNIYDEKKRKTKVEAFITVPPGLGNIVAVSGVVKTYDISITQPTLLEGLNLIPEGTEEEKKEMADDIDTNVSHVSITPWFNAREVVIFPADKNATKAREMQLEKRKNDSVDALMQLVAASNAVSNSVSKKRKIE